MDIQLITILMFGSLFFLLGLGLPVAFASGTVGIVFTVILQGPAALNLVPTRIFGLMVQYLLAAVPLFIFMACILEQSGVIDDLYEMVYHWVGFLRGGLAAATVLACTMMAAMVGVIGASEVTMGVIALPQMLKRGYNKFIACGSILAGGTLGILIPPSVMLIIYGLVDNSSIGQLYAGAILPGLLLSSLFITYVLLRCGFRPELGPPVPKHERVAWGVKFRLLGRVILPGILVFLVLGTIFTGIAAPTEAAGVGAAGAMLLTAIQGKLKWRNVVLAAQKTLNNSAMVLWTMFGANIFVGLYVMVGGAHFVQETLMSLGGGKWGVIIIMQLILIFLGCFIDWTGIIMLCVPLFGPIIRQLGFDPIWFGILFATNLQISFISPPFGYALFYLKGVAPPEIQTTDLWKSAVPFIGLQIIGVICVMFIPELSLWLPRVFYH